MLHILMFAFCSSYLYFLFLVEMVKTIQFFRCNNLVVKYTNLPFKAVNDLEANSSLVIKTPTT